MATTRLMPLHTGKGRTVGQAISAIIDYTENPQKTDGGRLITSWQCDSRIADAEFLFTKNQYIQKTGRVRGEDDVIAYHLRQSFVPGEITPEEANRLGCELAKRFTKGNHAYIVCTHIDKAHIHNHVIWNSTALSQTRKFRNFWGSSRAVRRLNDTICIENGYSMDANEAIIRLTREDFASEEEFLKWKSLSDADYHASEKEDHVYANHTLALDELSEEAASIPAADICMEQAHDRVAEIRRSTQKVTQIRKHLTDTQFRRMWMYFVDGMTIDEIGKVEGVSHQAISLNITAAIRKIKKYF